MQEWIIAMLVVSILLILRDMAKTVFSGRTQAKEEMMPLSESHPQKEKVECSILPETCGYILWNALQKGIFEWRTAEPDHFGY